MVGDAGVWVCDLGFGVDEGFLKRGGGGGMAARSRAALLGGGEGGCIDGVCEGSGIWKVGALAVIVVVEFSAGAFILLFGDDDDDGNVEDFSPLSSFSFSCFSTPLILRVESSLFPSFSFPFSSLSPSRLLSPS